MSKSQSTTTNQRPERWLVLALTAGGLVAGCGGGTEPWTIDPEGYDGIGEQTFALLTNPCTINTSTSTMSLSVRGTETLYLSLRAADSTVIADGQTGTGAECAVPATYKIAITEDGAHTGVEKVFLDYINGPFSLGSTANQVATPGITMALGAGSSLVIRGSGGVDKIYLGSTYTSNVLTYSWVNVNGDTSPDVRFTGITDVKVSTGVGADIISADGANGTTGVTLDMTVAFSAYGGPDGDTLTGGKGTTLLDGGDGDDKFVQTATAGPDNMVGGKGVDTVDYSVRTAAVNVTVCTVCAPSDPCACAATRTTCRSDADATQTTCTTGATATRASCNSDADDAQTSCYSDADDARATCYSDADDARTTCYGDADTAEATCITNCAGDTTCEAGCTTTKTNAYATCDQTRTNSRTTCDTTRTTSRGNCDTAHTTATGICTTAYNATVLGCTTAHTTAYSTCDSDQTACQSACGTPLCSVCTADDGAASEGDTVNDDVETVLGGKLNDTISAVFGVCSDQAATPTVKCTIKGNEGDDALTGSAFRDAIDGGAGNDVLLGGLGDDTLVGGAGVDTASYADRSVAVRVSLDSTRLWATGQNGATGENDSIGTDIENLTGGSGNDSLRGNSSPNIIHGGLGNDTLEGATGADALYGDAGGDFIYGGAGNDMLVGGAGADTLVGGDGDDFIDSHDSPATADTLISCDGVNDSANTAGTSAGTADALVKDSSDGSTSTCEL